MIFLCAGFTKPGVTRGLLLGILGGGVPLGSPNPDPIPDQKNVLFHSLFQTSPLLINITCTQIRTSTKRFLKIHFDIRIKLFLPYSFGIETTNTFIHSRNSLKNHTRFQTKMDKSIPIFIPKRGKNHTLRGRNIPIWLI